MARQTVAIMLLALLAAVATTGDAAAAMGVSGRKMLQGGGDPYTGNDLDNLTGYTVENAENQVADVITPGSGGTCSSLATDVACGGGGGGAPPAAPGGKPAAKPAAKKAATKAAMKGMGRRLAQTNKIGTGEENVANAVASKTGGAAPIVGSTAGLPGATLNTYDGPETNAVGQVYNTVGSIPVAGSTVTGADQTVDNSVVRPAIAASEKATTVNSSGTGSTNNLASKTGAASKATKGAPKGLRRH